MNFKTEFFALFFVIFWCSTIESQTEEALFFDWKEKRLVEMSKYIDEASCSSCLSACSADSNSEREKLMEEKISISGNGAFLRNFYQDLVKVKDTLLDGCETSPKPALVWDILSNSYEAGYELYYEEGSFEEADCLWYKYFRKVIKGDPNLNPKENPNENVIKIHDNPTKNTKFELVQYPGEKMVFYWILVLHIEVSPLDSNEKQRVIIYTKDTINNFFLLDDTTCLDYYTGDGRIIKYTNLTEEQEQEQAKTNANRLVKTQIIPMLMFHTISARVATCVYLNVAFIWRSIAEGEGQLPKVDLFLYGLYSDSPSDLNISFGVNGDSNRQGEIAQEDEIFQIYPVPKILFRVVEYTIKDQVYGASVVIHNDLNPIQDTDRICLTEAEGWDRFRNTNAATGISYACLLTPDVVQKLGFGEKWQRLSKMKPLEWNKLPAEDRLRRKYESILDKVRGKINQAKSWKFADFMKKFKKPAK